MSSTVKFTFLIVNNFNDNLFYYRIELPPLARIEISKISDAYDKRLFVNYSDDPWTVSELQRFHLWFFYFMMVQKWYTFNRNHTLNLDLFPGLPYALGSSLMMLDSGSEPQLPISLANAGWTRDTTVLFFTFSTVFNQLHELFNALL